jgi:Putative 2OG-Fe(II) oxygenase
MNIDRWFPTVVSCSDDNLTDKLDIYRTYCEEITNGIPLSRPFTGSQLVSTFNQTMPQYDRPIEKDLRFNELFDLILEKGSLFAEFLGYKYNLEISHAWVNKIQANDYHELHNHALGGSALISGVFYVCAPSSAFLRFRDNIETYSPVPPTAHTPYNNKHATYQCLPGRLIFFKSDVLHGYDSHLSDDVKYSIAFDLSVKL